jgi:very-short-patch-repair endonuclease
VTRAAEAHFGLTTRSQCKKSTLSEDAIERKVRAGHLVEVMPYVYRLAGVPESRLQRLAAAAYWSGASNALSHSSAAEVLRLDGHSFRAIDAALHVTFKNGVRTRGPVTVHRTKVLPDHHRTCVDGIFCTSAARTIVDLAATSDEEALTAAAESERRMGIMSISEVERVLRDLDTRRAGIAQLRRYVEVNRDQPALQYLLEVKLAKLLRDSELPPFTRQHRVRVLGGRTYRVDFARPGIKLAVEAVGFRWHGNVLQWKQDHRRVAALEQVGWRMLFLDSDDVTERGDESIARVALAIAERVRPAA